MFGSLVALLLLVNLIITNEPLYAIAAGLFELAGVLYAALPRPRRLQNKEGNQNANPSR